jgi:hypothetical protein
MIERLIDRPIPKPCATAVEAENPMLSVRAIRTTVACRYSLKVSAVSIVEGWEQLEGIRLPLVMIDDERRLVRRDQLPHPCHRGN